MDTTLRAGEPDEPRGHTEAAHDHHVPYWVIFYALLVMTAVTVGVAFYRFHNELANVALALLVATIKGILVARYFMHVKFEGKLIRLILLAPIFLCIVMLVALIPDIGKGRDTAMNDVVGKVDAAAHAGPESGHH